MACLPKQLTVRANEGKDDDRVSVFSVQGANVTSYVHTPVAGILASQRMDSEHRVSWIYHQNFHSFNKLLLNLWW